jgi:hypothetical protein
MEPATESHRTSGLSAAAAGLQAGMLGVWWMLVWMGLNDVFQRRSFWTSENLMASAFYGDRAIRAGFALRTVSGLALYVALYSLLGLIFAFVLNDRIPRLRTFLLCAAFGMVWYYVSFHILWKSILPLVALLHSSQSTAVGHLLYGSVLGRYPAYLIHDSPEPATANEHAKVSASTADRT